MSHFTPGTQIQALDPASNRWRDAIIESDAPYPRGQCGGAYVFWDPLPSNMWESTGGWISERCIRPRPLVNA